MDKNTFDILSRPLGLGYTPTPKMNSFDKVKNLFNYAASGMNPFDAAKQIILHKPEQTKMPKLDISGGISKLGSYVPEQLKTSLKQTFSDPMQVYNFKNPAQQGIALQTAGKAQSETIRPMTTVEQLKDAWKDLPSDIRIGGAQALFGGKSRDFLTSEDLRRLEANPNLFNKASRFIGENLALAPGFMAGGAVAGPAIGALKSVGKLGKAALGGAAAFTGAGVEQAVMPTGESLGERVGNVAQSAATGLALGAGGYGLEKGIGKLAQFIRDPKTGRTISTGAISGQGIEPSSLNIGEVSTAQGRIPLRSKLREETGELLPKKFEGESLGGKNISESEAISNIQNIEGSIQSGKASKTKENQALQQEPIEPQQSLQSPYKQPEPLESTIRKSSQEAQRNVLGGGISRDLKSASEDLKSANSYLKDSQNIQKDQVLNLDRLNVSQQSKDFINSTLDEIKPKIEEAVGKKMSNQEVIDYAKENSGILNKTIGRDKTLELGAEALNLRQQLAKMSETGVVTKDFIDTLIKDKAFSSNTARLLQQRSIMADPLAKNQMVPILEKVIEHVGNVDEVLKAAKNVDFNDFNQATDFYRQFIKPKASEWIDLLRYNSMLSSPKTHIVNAVSNATNSILLNPLQKAVAGGLDFLHHPFDYSKRKYFVGETGAYIKNYFKNSGKAAQDFANVLRGRSGFTNLDLQNIPIANKGFKGGVVKTLSFPSRVLEGMDQFFTGMATAGEKAALDFKVRKGVKVENIVERAKEKAAYTLFRQDLLNKDQGYALNVVDHVTSLFDRARNSPDPILSTVSKFTFPFLKTPMNILKQGFEHNPLGAITMWGASNKTEQLAKAIIGSSVMAGAATLAASNALVGEEPIDEKAKRDFRAANLKPWSVKVGNKVIQFQQLAPGISFPLAAVTAMQDAFANKKLDENGVDAILTGMAKNMNFFANQSYAKGMGDLIDSVRGGKEGITNLVSNYPKQVIPFRAFTGWITRLVDDVQRKATTDKKGIQGFVDKQVQQFMIDIPGLSGKVPARLDAQGNPIKNTNNVLSSFTPGNVSTINKEGLDLYNLRNESRKMRSESTDIRSDLKQQAIQLDKQFLGMPKDEAKQKFNQLKSDNPPLYNVILDVIKDRRKGLTEQDQIIQGLGVENGDRAKIIRQQLDRLETPDERIAYALGLEKKGIINAKVKEQLIRIKKQRAA